VPASADTEAIKTAIEKTRAMIQNLEDKLAKSNLEINGKLTKPGIIKSQLDNFNKTTTKQYEAWLKLNKDYVQSIKDAQKAKQENEFLRHEQVRLTNLLLELYQNKTDSQTAGRIKTPTFIGLVLSESCKAAHCMTYADLIQYDESIQKVSGKLNPDGSRQKSKYQNFYRWYPLNYTHVEIDPNPQIFNYGRAAIIEIFPSNFTLVSMRGNPQDSLKSGHLIEWQNLGHDSECSYSIVTANHTAIKRAINYYKSGCVDKGFFEKKTELKKTPFRSSESVSYQQMKHWKNAAANCKVKC
jgi:hypothetical protein